MGILAKLGQQFSRFRSDDEGGVSTLEFVILAPVLFFMFFATFEAGWLMVRQVMLDRGVDMAMREVRLNIVPGITKKELRENICEEALGITNCTDNLRIEMLSLEKADEDYPVRADGRNWPHTDVTCQEKGELIDPIVDAESFGSNEADVLMVVVVCVMVDPMVPGLGGLVPGIASINATLEDKKANGYKMTSFAAYKAEPEI